LCAARGAKKLLAATRDHTVAHAGALLSAERQNAL